MDKEFKPIGMLKPLPVPINVNGGVCDNNAVRLILRLLGGSFQEQPKLKLIECLSRSLPCFRRT